MSAIQSVYDPIGNRYKLYTILIGIRYRLYTILQGSDKDCIRSHRGPIQAVYNPTRTRYKLYPII